MLTVIYGLIIIAATFLGAFVGLGGGVVIKPLLDLIGKSPIDKFYIIVCRFCNEHKLDGATHKSKNKNQFQTDNHNFNRSGYGRYFRN